VSSQARPAVCFLRTWVKIHAREQEPSQADRTDQYVSRRKRGEKEMVYLLETLVVKVIGLPLGVERRLEGRTRERQDVDVSGRSYLVADCDC
jgi:hypothetical protein